ncbi:hypothetical protein Tco_1170266, partial [Tanacetum coccineum]
MYYKKNVNFAELIWEEFQYQIDYMQTKLRRREIMPYPRFTKINLHYFLSQHKSISKRQGSYVNIIKDDGVLGRLKFVSKGEDYQVYGTPIPYVMVKDEIKISEAYQTYIALSTGLIPPEKGRGKGSKGKKATVTPKKKGSITVDDNIILEPDVAFELGKSISRTEAEIAEEARRVHETHERLVTEKPTSLEESNEFNGEPAKRTTGIRRPTGVGSSGAKVVAEINWGSKDDSAQSDDEDRSIDIKETDDEEIKSNNDDQVMDDAEKNDAEKPDEEKMLINQSMSSNYGNQFLNTSSDISLIGTIQEDADTEINSLLDVQIQQEIPTALSAPLLDVLMSVIPEQSTPPTPTPLTTPLPAPQITSEAPPVTTIVPDLLLAVIQRLEDLERIFDAWTKVDHSEAVKA